MNLNELLTKREGLELTVYKDSVGVLTVGVGHKVLPADKLKLGDKITKDQAMAFLRTDSASALSAAKSQAAKAGISDSDFIVYLASVNFQLGTGWTSKFPKTWKLILEGKYEDAAKEAAKSTWNSQTPVRVKDFQGALKALPPKKK